MTSYPPTGTLIPVIVIPVIVIPVIVIATQPQILFISPAAPHLRSPYPGPPFRVR
jgi:hypothetical protein